MSTARRPNGPRSSVTPGPYQSETPVLLTGPRRSILIVVKTCRGAAGEGKFAPRIMDARHLEEAVASRAPTEADTFPKLLIRNARNFGDRPAMRHKDLGIWQTLTWAQLLDEVRAYAVGLHRLGLKRGDTMAIVGANRPRLYASVMAAQALGVVPVPVYADAVADELSYVLAHAEVRFAAVEDQEQVDKILSVSDRLPKLETMVYDEKRGFATTTTPGFTPWRTSSPTAARPWRTTPRSAPGSTARSRRARAPTPRSPLHVGDHRAVQGRGAVGRALHRRRLRHGCLRQIDGEGRGAGLSAARLGRRPLSQLRAGPGRRLLHGLPGERRHRDGGPARDRPDVLLRAAAHLRADADPRDDPHGGRELSQAPHVSLFHRRGAALRRENPEQAAGRPARPARVLARQHSGLCAAEERARAIERARRLHRGRGDRAGPVLVLPLARPEPEAALRPDRGLPVSDRAAGRTNLCRHRRSGAAERRPADRRQRRGAVQVARHVSSATSRTTPRPRRR